VALDTGNKNICGMLKAPEDKHNCILIISIIDAYKADDLSSCATFDTKNDRNACYWNFAYFKKDYSICKKMSSSEEFQQTCAMYEPDPNIPYYLFYKGGLQRN
jgi:hypothetical protein